MSFPPLFIRIYFEDTDFSGVVYHAAYLKFFERGRSEALRSTGLDHRALIDSDDPVALTVRSLEISYHRPARIDDLLTIETKVIEIRGARMVFQQTAKKDELTLAEARVTTACMDLEGRPRRMPKAIIDRMPSAD